MPTNAPLTVDLHDVFFLSPHIVLTFWGLLVLLVDLGLAKRLSSAARRQTIGWLSLVGVGLASGRGRGRLPPPYLRESVPRTRRPSGSASERRQLLCSTRIRPCSSAPLPAIPRSDTSTSSTSSCWG